MRGLEGNFQAQPRVFAHDAVNVTPSGTAVGSIANTDQRGCCLYVGQAMTLTVQTEGGTGTSIFKGVAAGSFLPVLVTSVTDYTLTDTAGTKGDWDIVALF